MKSINIVISFIIIAVCIKSTFAQIATFNNPFIQIAINSKTLEELISYNLQMNIKPYYNQDNMLKLREIFFNCKEILNQSELTFQCEDYNRLLNPFQIYNIYFTREYLSLRNLKISRLSQIPSIPASYYDLIIQRFINTTLKQVCEQVWSTSFSTCSEWLSSIFGEILNKCKLISQTERYQCEYQSINAHLNDKVVNLASGITQNDLTRIYHEWVDFKTEFEIKIGEMQRTNKQIVESCISDQQKKCPDFIQEKKTECEKNTSAVRDCIISIIKTEGNKQNRIEAENKCLKLIDNSIIKCPFYIEFPKCYKEGEPSYLKTQNVIKIIENCANRQYNLKCPQQIQYENSSLDYKNYNNCKDRIDEVRQCLITHQSQFFNEVYQKHCMKNVPYVSSVEYSDCVTKEIENYAEISKQFKLY